MGTISDLGRTYLRKNVIDGNANSGKNQPHKADGIATFDEVERRVSAAEGTAVSGVKPSLAVVSVLTTTNITLSGEQTIHGVTTSASRVGVTGQTLGQNNGVWVTGAGAWTRAADANTAAEVGYCIFRVAPTDNTYGGTQWQCEQSAADITGGGGLGTTVLTFRKTDDQSTEAAIRAAADTSLQNQINIVAKPSPLLDPMVFDRLDQASAVAAFGRVFGARAIASTFKGWRGDYPYAGQSFDTVAAYFELEIANTEVTLVVYDDDGTTPVVTVTRQVAGLKGYHEFDLGQTVSGSDITGSWLRIGFWTTDGTTRMMPGTVLPTSIANPTVGQFPQAYKTTPGGSWNLAGTDMERPAIALYLRDGLYPKDTANTTTLKSTVFEVDGYAVSGTTMATALSSFEAPVATSSISGYGVKYTCPVSGTSNFMRFPAIGRLDVDVTRRWRYLYCALRDGTTTGNVKATGMIRVDPLRNFLSNVVIPFTDPKGNAVTVNFASDFPSGFVVAEWHARSETGDYVAFGPQLGVVNLYAGEAYFQTTSNDTWNTTASILYTCELGVGTITNTIKKIVRADSIESMEVVPNCIPPFVYAEGPGGAIQYETRMYADNLFQRRAWLTHHPVAVEGTLVSDGEAKARAYAVKPAAPGDQTVTWNVRSDHQKLIPVRSSTVRTSAWNALAAKNKKGLFFGDSLTVGAGGNDETPTQTRTAWMKARWTASGGTLTWYGTQGTVGDLNEGHGGKRWGWFSGNEIDGDTNPFANAGVFDLPNYRTVNAIPQLDFVIGELGTNEIVPGGDPDGGADQAEKDFQYILSIGSSIFADSGTRFVVCTPPPLALTPDAYSQGSSLTVPTSNWEAELKHRNYVQYCDRLQTYLQGRESIGIHYCPIHHMIDPLHSFNRSTPRLVNDCYRLDHTFTTYSAMLADLAWPNRAIALCTEDSLNEYFVKVGASGKGFWQLARDVDGVVRPQTNAPHPRAVGYRQMANAIHNFMLWFIPTYIP